MFRTIVAVLAAYAVLVICALLMVGSFLLLWPNAFSPDMHKSYAGPEFILYLEISLSLLFAVLAGVVATAIGGRRAALALAGVMLVLGAVTIVSERGMKPMWSFLAVTAMGPIGAMAGSRLRRDRPRTS
jgi:hypothetical protein